MNPIDISIEQTLNQYFSQLDGERASGLYDLVMGCTERSLLEFLMKKYADNQSQVAEALGINRNTLRSKLIKHELKTA
ncbi:MAG: hypothetical protein RLZZ502_165 [Pseudomonadota bacterium]|jgi:Fis family transcriptional regulator